MTSTTEAAKAVIIGAGQAGTPLAQALARAGWRTIIVERADIGGTCINVGCTPTKTMVASARVAYVARRAAEYGVRVGRVSVDLVAVRARKREMVATFRAGSERRLAGVDGLEVVYGDARLVSTNVVEVRSREGANAVRRFQAEAVFINTGCRPARPAIPGLDTIAVLDSTSIQELDVVPDHLVIIGGGFIAVEFAQMFRRFGSAVTIVQRSAGLLSREDADVTAALLDLLREDGIDVLLHSDVLSARSGRGGRPTLRIRTPAGDRSINGSHVLVATGRVPNTEDLGLEAAGVETADGGFIRVDDRLRTTAPGVWALGDVKGGPAFTHASYDDYRVARANVLDGTPASIADRLMPYVTFTDPQLGRVGLSEAQARAAGRSVRVARLPMDASSRAWEIGERRGLLKAVVDADSGLILGAAILGFEGGELLAALQIAMLAKLPASALADAIFAHPTFAETFNTLFTSGWLDD